MIRQKQWTRSYSELASQSATDQLNAKDKDQFVVNIIAAIASYNYAAALEICAPKTKQKAAGTVSLQVKKMSSVVRQRHWFFEPKHRQIYLIRNGQEMTSFSGMKLEPIKDVSIGKEHSKGSNQAWLVSQLQLKTQILDS